MSRGAPATLAALALLAGAPAPAPALASDRRSHRPGPHTHIRHGPDQHRRRPARAAAVPARLQGAFAMQGVVIRARNILGEHPGRRVHRRWSFSSTCPQGPCARVTLVRVRAGGVSERLVLHRLGGGVYGGRSRFFVALRCGRRVDRRGGRVPFTITVRITAAAQGAAGPVATAITARYVNARRINLTRCPGGIGSDAARYEGRLIEPPPPPPAPESPAEPAPEPPPEPAPEPAPEASPAPAPAPSPAPEAAPASVLRGRSGAGGYAAI